MKKILLSFLAIILTVGVVSGTAYALFSSTVTVSGITLATGNANLVIRDGNINGQIINGYTGLSFNKMYPGFRDYGSFNFQNSSNSQIDLALTAQLTHAEGDWDLLKNNIFVAIGTGTKDNPNFLTGWISLSDWNASSRSLGVPVLAYGQNATYNLYVYVPADADNTIAGKTLSNVTFVVTGTQVTP